MTFDAYDWSGISSICTVNELWCDQNNVGSASSMGLFLILWPIVDFSHLFLNGYDLFSSFRTKDKFIHSQESLLESSLIVPFFVILIRLEFLNEMSFDKLWYFSSCYIKNKDYLHGHRKLRKASFSYRSVAIGQCEHLPCKFSSLK